MTRADDEDDGNNGNRRQQIENRKLEEETARENVKHRLKKRMQMFKEPICRHTTARLMRCLVISDGRPWASLKCNHYKADMHASVNQIDEISDGKHWLPQS